MNAAGLWGRAAMGLRWVVVVCGMTAVAGCDLGLEDSSNRYEQLNIETKKLLDVLYQIKDEATATANLTALEEAAGRVRDVQQKIRDSEAKRAEQGKEGGMGRVTNFRQASIWQQTGDSARRRVKLIREADAKAGDLVDKAVEGIEFPAPPPEVSLPNAG